MQSPRATGRSLIVIAAALLAGCGGGATSPRNSPVATVSVVPSSAEISVDSTLRLQATLTDAGGRVLTNRAVFWTSSNDGVAQVSDQGVVTGVAPGSVQVSASSEGKYGLASVTVFTGVAGTWMGTCCPSAVVGPTRITMQLVQSGNNVTGNGSLNDNSLQTAIAVTGTEISSQVNLTFTFPNLEFAPVRFTGTHEGNTMPGTLNGSGFRGDTITFTKSEGSVASIQRTATRARLATP